MLTSPTSLLQLRQLFPDRGEHGIEARYEAVEMLVGHSREQQFGELLTTHVQRPDGPRPVLGERHERRSPIRRVWLPGDEAGRDQRVDETGDVPRTHVQRLGQNTLRARAEAMELPEQVSPGRGQTVAFQTPGHVVVDQDGELEHPVERRAVLLHATHTLSHLHYICT